jgi:hypothetical protein
MVTHQFSMAPAAKSGTAMRSSLGSGYLKDRKGTSRAGKPTRRHSRYFNGKKLICFRTPINQATNPQKKEKKRGKGKGK